MSTEQVYELFRYSILSTLHMVNCIKTLRWTIIKISHKQFVFFNFLKFLCISENISVNLKVWFAWFIVQLICFMRWNKCTWNCIVHAYSAFIRFNWLSSILLTSSVRFSIRRWNNVEWNTLRDVRSGNVIVRARAFLGFHAVNKLKTKSKTSKTNLRK